MKIQSMQNKLVQLFLSVAINTCLALHISLHKTLSLFTVQSFAVGLSQGLCPYFLMQIAHTRNICKTRLTV